MFKTSHVLLTCQHHLIFKLCLDPLNRRKGIVYYGCKVQSWNDMSMYVRLCAVLLMLH